ncbi:unnamed protein product [Cunninghamella echinulata]
MSDFGEELSKWKNEAQNLMEDYIMEDDNAFERNIDERKISPSEMISGLDQMFRYEYMEEKGGDAFAKGATKNIVHQNFFNEFEDDFNDDDLA